MSSMLQLAMAGLLAGSFALPLQARAELRRADSFVAGPDGSRLFVREISENTPSSAKPPVILLHGARVPGIASFDLPVEGGSLAADLARAGHRVFVMDARGYGGSTRPGQEGPADGPPLSRSEDVIADLGAVVNAVKASTGAERVALVGWATGGHWAGMYASRAPENVSHVVIYNSLYGAQAGHKALGPGSDTADPQDPRRFNFAKFGAYRLNTAASLMPAWDSSIPTNDKDAWRDPKVAEAYRSAALASDPASASRNPPAFRAPSGAMADSFELASGRKLWHANAITAHVLVLRSANDFWSRPEDVVTLEADLTNAASVRAVTIPQATHHVHLDRAERGRSTFLAELGAFLAKSPALGKPTRQGT
ncbi:alpha/beta fold hydrolase [Bradyrhizobium sp. LHD-71]|uniref:alpha/beta fold hydrolase n=1 Tax=Bradyrhizobium sp. LHD-71 TaxID=3072141 RepID=UPI00280F17E0|nr:alpha/beta fold hydrolase [Bradyrhizobium sp. LHD-71]MDQ8731136.1 alpha/beta fold hydrolase [Bradyrhizobium sp. LHD-71]